MRLPLILTLGTALVSLGLAAPVMADGHGERAATPVAVPLTAEELLAPYYARLRETVEMPEAGPNPALAADTRLTRIAFGSCNHQSASQHMWEQIARQNPQAFLMIGDNVYGDNAWDGDAGLESLRAAYAEQAAHPEFASFRARFPMLASWDDHDFGLNDKGASFPFRGWAEELFETFWNSSDEVRSRPGTHDSVIVGPEGQRLQIIMLDTRFFRSDLKRMPWSAERPPLGIYLPDDSMGATVLGAAQWAWLEAELAKPADLRIVVSSIQIITEAHDYESWENFPRERTRLLNMLAAREDSGMVMLSGDRHSGGIYKLDHGGETMWELTSSSLNLAFGDIEGNTAREPDPKRVSPFFGVENYGLVDIDWEARELTITLLGAESQTYARQSFDW
ncbi:alkaline phosphatase D family protein [Qipengyuania sp. ASV99]|uniref:alkaline phosphatase D family protein n=1 Tax=Qipengyuania sp. ASV99 TaxID=3399681 RepID=UPI003A4C69B1